MTTKRLRSRLAEFMTRYFSDSVRKRIPDWDGKPKSLEGYIDPLRDAPYVILVIRRGGFPGFDDIVALGVRK